MEIDAAVRISDKFTITPNVALSSNKNVDFVTTWDGAVVDLGNTDIAYSPNVVASNAVVYQPTNNVQFSFLTKFVGEQFMGNIDNKNSKLDSYFVNDFNASYEINPKSVFKAIIFNALINNIFNTKYISNGYYGTYDYEDGGQTYTGDYAGYYPQATRNFLIGATLKF